MTYTRKGGIFCIIKSFKDKETEKLYNDLSTKKIPNNIKKIARRKLMLIDNVSSLQQLTIPPGNHLEALLGKQTGRWSIRINKQWRITFTPINGGSDYEDVAIEDYH